MVMLVVVTVSRLVVTVDIVVTRKRMKIGGRRKKVLSGRLEVGVEFVSSAFC